MIKLLKGDTKSHTLWGNSNIVLEKKEKNLWRNEFIKK